MITLKTLLISSLILINCSRATDQEFKAGLIVPKNSEDWYSEKYCCIVTPEKGFSVFDKPNGKKLGILKKKISSDEENNYKIYLTLNSAVNESFENYKEIGYEISALNFVDVQNGFLKLNGKKELWINKNEIDQQNFKTVSWKEFLLIQNDKVLGYYAKEPGLIVRKEPNLESEIIGSCRGDLFEIKLTKEFQGKWCKVKITKYREHPCATELEEIKNIETKYEGWMKIIDDHDESNIWNYTRGC